MEPTDTPTPTTPSARTKRRSPFLRVVAPVILLLLGGVAFAEWWTGMWDPELFSQRRGSISLRRGGGDGPPPDAAKAKARSKGASKKAEPARDQAPDAKAEPKPEASPEKGGGPSTGRYGPGDARGGWRGAYPPDHMQR
ncbi:MAG: hypothetical protein U0835_22390 [Isosphaeraceae bacterium]